MGKTRLARMRRGLGRLRKKREKRDGG